MGRNRQLPSMLCVHYVHGFFKSGNFRVSLNNILCISVKSLACILQKKNNQLTQSNQRANPYHVKYIACFLLKFTVCYVIHRNFETQSKNILYIYYTLAMYIVDFFQRYQK